MNQLSVDLTGVPETLLIPLYGRAVETRKKRPLLRDPQALAMVEALDYDFSKFDGARSLFGSVLRTAMLDQWVGEFLHEHPTGTVVEVGCGLNTRFERLDNGRLHWFDLDLPESIELRQRFFVDTDRRTMISSSILDEDWIGTVRSAGGPWFFVIEAVLCYLSQAQVQRGLSLITQHFPGAGVAFDTAGSFMVRSQDQHDVLKAMDARFEWACDDPRVVEDWGLGLKLQESRTFLEAQPAVLAGLPFGVQTLLPVMKPVIRKLLGEKITTYKLNLYSQSRR